jgi:thiamine-phosphate pyrophosphorylase
VVFPRLHVITDSLDVVRAVVGVGPVAVQIRVKSSARIAFSLASAALPICRDAGALCLVDDRVEVALAAGADGVHVGESDLPVSVARRLLGPSAVVGATCRDISGIRRAVADGASYVGLGPVFATSTKDGLPPPLGPSFVAAVAAAVPDVPVIAIGGITVDRVPELGTYGVAVISAVAADPAGATASFLKVLS